VGIFDTFAKTFSSSDRDSSSAGGTGQPPRSRPARDRDRGEDRAQRAALAHAFQLMRGALIEATRQATRDFQSSKTAVMKDIESQLLRLKHERAVLVRAPDQMPLVDPDKAATFFSDIAAREALLAQQLEQIYADLQPTYRAIAERMAAEQTPAPTMEWAERAEQERLRLLAMARAHLKQVGGKAADLADELERFRAEVQATDFTAAKAGFDPAQPLLRQFRKGMMLGAMDLVQIRRMIDAEWTAQHAAFAKLSFKDVLRTAGEWQRDGMSAEATDFVIAMFRRLTLFQALREMGLDKADAFKPDPPAKQVPGADRPSGAELLTRFPGDLPLTTDDQRDRLIDALVLASECSLPPTEIFALRQSLGQLTPVPVAQGDEARLGHYHQLHARLEASALETIGKATGQKCQNYFMPLHLVLLRQLRDAASIAAPSAALAAWERHLANREAIRADMFSRASAFWQPLLTVVIDSPSVSDNEKFVNDRTLLEPLSHMDPAARAVVLDEATALFKAFRNTAFGMASKADGWLSITAPFGSSQRDRVRTLIDVLSMTDAVRAAYFAPPPEAPPLGKFADLVTQLAARRNHFNDGPFGQAMHALDFAAADREVQHWLAAAPQSPLRDAMLQFDPATLRISDREGFDRLCARPATAAVGLDWSGHVTCEVSAPGQGVPFEMSAYGRGAFPEGEFGVEMLRSHARNPFPWQGMFDDVAVDMDVEGIAPLVLQLYPFRGEVRDDWGKELRAYHSAMDELCTAFMFLVLNRLIARELAAKPPARAVPVIVGTHDFGYFDPVIHDAGLR